MVAVTHRDGAALVPGMVDSHFIFMSRVAFFCCIGWVCALGAMGVAVAEESGPGWLIRTWDSDDGLPQNSVVSLAQTEAGYLWAATLMGGVARFDGGRFVNFEPANTPQLVSPEGHLLFPAAGGSLLVAQNGGAVARWRGGGEGGSRMIL